MQWYRSLVVIALAGCGFFPPSPISYAGTEPLASARKPSPIDSTFHGCGPDGSPPDAPLNRLKNRLDSAAYVPTPWQVVARLTWPPELGYLWRDQWTRSQRRAVSRYEGAPISIEGYVVGHRLVGREPTNCYSIVPSERDFHIWFAERPGEPRRNTIVAEISPRIRAMHMGWTDALLDSLEASRARVRLSGWLMFDQDHPELVGVNRITLWEVHPIMRIEIQRSDSSWVLVE